MAKRKFLKSLFITLGCALVVGTVGALIYLDRVERVVENKNDSIVDNISFDDASIIFGKENITMGQNGDITISKFQPQTNGDEKFDKIILPSKIDNKNVTYSEDYYKELRNYFKGNGDRFDSSKTSAIKKLFIGDEEGFKHLRLQEAVTNAPSFLRGLEYAEIGKGANNIPDGFFKGAKKLKEVEISTSIKTIGYQAFYACSSLVDVNFIGNDNKIWIDSAAFANCTNLKNVDFAEIKGFDYSVAKLPTDKANVTFWSLWWLFSNSGSKENKVVITSTSEFKSEIVKISDYLKEKGNDVMVADNISFNVTK